jgi:ATP-binding cassette subfamily B protein
MYPRLEKFLSYYKPYKLLLSADLSCAIVIAVITLSLPLCARYITESILTLDASDALTQIFYMASIMLALVAVHALCKFFVDYMGHFMGALMERDMRGELFAHLQTQPFSFYDEHKVGQLMTRVTNDTYNLAELYHHGPEDILITLIKFFGTFLILMTINVQLTLLIFACLPPMVVYAFHFNRKMNIALRAARDRIGDVNARVEDSLGGIRVSKSFTNAEFENNRFAIENERFLESRRHSYKSEAYLDSGIVAFTQIFTVIVIGVGGSFIIQGPLRIVDLVTFLLYVGLLVEPIHTALNFSRLYQSGITGFDRVMELLEVEPAIADHPHATILTKATGKVEFENVSFRYSESAPWVIQNLSLSIKPGEFVALVGPSGVGKSTLCALIPRFYEATAGSISIDGHTVTTLTQESLQKNIGVVQQDTYLFDGTIAENIHYGNLAACDEDVIACAKKANAHDFIMTLENGYQTEIGQRGVKLSGGQKQRLSIARAFLKDPAILIFDEATSALDNQSESAIQLSLERLSKNRTTIVIAHRLSTVQNAERIIVLGVNGIIEQGKHQELIEQDGHYSGLYALQASI